MPELRKDPITGRWVIIAGDRPKHPADFLRSPVSAGPLRVCPFCPGQEEKTPPEVLAFRQSGEPNQPGWSVRVVPNKFPVLQVEGDLDRQGDGMFDRMNGIGAHEVIVESPDHKLTWADMPERQLEDVFWAYRARILDLRKDFRLRYITVFRNYGEAAGSLIGHPHSELVALPVIPKRALEELEGCRAYHAFKERCVYCDIVQQEVRAGVRLVTETDRFVVIQPYAPRFPFETWVIPQRHNSHFENADPPTMQNLAWVLRVTLRQIEKTLENPAYNLVLHSAPVQEAPMAHDHWHIELMPKLTRVAGFEWGTGFYINPTPPEESARFLKQAAI
ncbi:MAG: galactose-1-phosphate uridylyltransferase [Bryobacterales bacterium]|nr:galactose-1-phosphate uridylyltransferase [Bryobacterales bacterium]